MYHVLMKSANMHGCSMFNICGRGDRLFCPYLDKKLSIVCIDNGGKTVCFHARYLIF
jgi:hypothetical protein